MTTVHPAFVFVLALAAGVLCQSLARHLRVPGIVLLLAAGVGLGPDGLGWVEPDALGTGLQTIVSLAVAVILFEGGLNLEIRRLRREQVAIRRLVTLGAFVTTAGGAIAVHELLGWDVIQSLLFGTLVVVTGPTVIGPLIQDLRLRRRAATVLEAEGVLIDPIGAILAVVMLEVALAPTADSFTGGAGGLLLRLGFGAGFGAVAGFALAGLLRIPRIVPEGLENIFVLASVLLVFQSSQEVVHESGIVAVVAMGVVVGNLRSRFDRDIREFKDQLTVLMIGLLFVLLAADVRLAEVASLGWQAAGVVGVLVLVVRPLSVWLCTRTSELSAQERWFIAWIAPRGIVAAAVASVTAEALTGAGIEGGTELRGLVFLTIAATVVLAGLTARPVGSLLGVRMPNREGVAILGAAGLGLELGKLLREGGKNVIFLDANPDHCRAAEELGFPVVFGNAIQERTMQRARFEGVGTVIGTTSNQVLNSVFASRARENFRVPEGLIAVSQPRSGFAMELVGERHARMLFEAPHDIERWDVRARRGEIAVESWAFQGEPMREEGDKPPTTGELMVFLTVRRGSKVLPVYGGLAWREGDVASVAVSATEREEAHRVLSELGFVPDPAPRAEEPDATA